MTRCKFLGFREEILREALNDPETRRKLEVAVSMREYEEALLEFARKRRIPVVQVIIP